LGNILKFESDNAFFERRQNYLYIRYKEFSRIDLEVAEMHAKIILDLCNGKRYPFVLDGLDLQVDFSHEARVFISEYEPVVKIRSAQAIVVNNTHNKLIANYFHKFHKPKNPIEIFSKFEDAVGWVKQFESK
jgi:hypothetical protein